MFLLSGAVGFCLGQGKIIEWFLKLAAGRPRTDREEPQQVLRAECPSSLGQKEVVPLESAYLPVFNQLFRPGRGLCPSVP